MTTTSLHHSHEQRKVEKLLLKLAKMKVRDRVSEVASSESPAESARDSRYACNSAGEGRTSS